MSSAMPVTAIFADFTVTEQVAVFPPSAVVTVTVVLPSFRAFTSPLLTDATLAFVLVQVTAPFVAVAGSTVATRFALSPSVRARDVLSSRIPVTATVLSQPAKADSARIVAASTPIRLPLCIVREYSLLIIILII